MKKKFSLDGQKTWEKYRDHTSVRISLYALLGLVLYVLMFANVAPEVIDVSLGTRAESNIASPVTIRDDRETERAQEIAAREVEPEYIKDDDITTRQNQNLDRTFIQIKEIAAEDIPNEEKLDKLRESIAYSLNEDSYNLFISYPVEEIETLRRMTTSIVYEIMYDGISQQNNGLNRAYQRVDDALMVSSLDEQMRAVSREMARAAIVPNFVLDHEETERLRQEARDRVGNIIIREGEIIVSEGEIISAEVYRKLRLVGLLSESANMLPYLGLAMYIILLIAALGVYISFSGLPIQKNNKILFMYILIFALTVSVMKIVNIFQGLQYTGVGFLIPVAFGTMLMTMLIHQRVAIFSSFVLALIAAIILNENVSSLMDISYAIIAIFSGLAGAYFLGAGTRKTKILQAGFVVSIVTVVSVFTITMLQNVTVSWIELSQHLLFAFLNGILASVLTIGFMPFFEAAFTILSSSKLIELSNPNHPLLRKVLIEAPGTYHHSVMVANLAEAAAEAIGANGLLARVGAYYHDVGKTKRPHFFIENQMNMENPHDKIAPHLSKTIITAHGRDGAQMLKEHNLPKAIQDIAEQHHGDSLLKYFYHKAKQEADTEVTESEFRYPGPKAQFKESAIVGIVDSVEAAVRSMSKPSPERIDNLVRNIIRDRLEDGQFDECDITLKELDMIAKAVCETLQGIFHSRIEYPEDKEKVKVLEK
ncbi:HD family phosphohydrolase [Bacillus horti]|uniref:Nucleotidyltransferase with HDIG domain n=1 Tax=Caldalkalibacillus horti TaxID=77523 RepID=A0ABT9W479_9BACI|nr:HD family phosphohydrolase [Bacillus horti]MDQ0168051.1 putative nucleotidyltransferase with HDIG domain [Bacillus horti]